MQNDQKRRRFFTRRSFILGGIKFALIGALGSRAYYLQIIKGRDYQSLSDQNRMKLVLYPADRGIIRDRYGLPITRNEQSWRLYLDTSMRRKNREELLRNLAQMLNIDADAFVKAVNRRLPVNHRLLLLEHMEWDQVSSIELRAPELPGIFVESAKLRVYPYPTTFSHVLGYVAPVAEKDPEAELFKRLPEMRIGKNGVEKSFDEELRGVPGVKSQEVNVTGQILKETPYKAPISGADMWTSLDMELQYFAHQRLSQEKSASCVLLDVMTGEVLVCASFPGYDPNEFGRGIRPDTWKRLLNDIRVPLMNKSIAGQYPPGSTYKMMVGLAGLKAGVVNPHTTFFCPGHFFLGNHRFNCWRHEGHGTVDYKRAIEVSCDVYFYNVGMRMPIDDVSAMVRKFGPGELTGVELPGEKAGLVPTEAWKKKRHKDIWRKGDSVNAAIGQGYVLATPMQLAVMAARLGTGKEVKPTMRRHPQGKPYPKWKDLDVNPDHLAIAKDGMYGVVNRGGTAAGKKLNLPDFDMAGKTGTSQVTAISRLKGIPASEQDWTQQHHALFVSYAPTANPRYAMAVVVEHGKSGSGAAAPIAKDVYTKLYELTQARIAGAKPAMPPPEPEDVGAIVGSMLR
ncbi:penicillin-binding protein 2 [bacterium]|nr:penicillin-binding protein 2 [bacterium]